MKYTHTSQKGFTLIETLIAIFILALTIGALLTLTAGGFFSIRYAKNDIVASNLLQESLEFIRNNRDTMGQQSLNDSSITWDYWKSQFDDCYGDDGCVINPYAPAGTRDFVAACQGGSIRGGANDCDPLTYLNEGIYVQDDLATVFESTGTNIKTSFVRNIFFEDIPVTVPVTNALTGVISDITVPQIRVTARMDWKNGTNNKHLTQSIILTPWNIPE